MWITVDDGPDKGKTVELSTGAFTIGRHPESNLVLADDEASSHHAVIETDAEGKATLRDLNSTNGTFLNGSKIEGGIPLEGSEHLRIGQSSLTVSERPPNATVISARPTVERPADAAPPSPPPSTSPVPSAPASPAPVLQGSVEDKPPRFGRNDSAASTVRAGRRIRKRIDRIRSHEMDCCRGYCRAGCRRGGRCDPCL